MFLPITIYAGVLFITIGVTIGGVITYEAYSDQWRKGVWRLVILTWGPDVDLASYGAYTIGA